MGGMIADPKLLLDQLSHPLGRPDPPPEPVGLGPFDPEAKAIGLTAPGLGEPLALQLLALAILLPLVSHPL